MARNVVFEIEDVGDDRDKAFLMGTVLIRLAEHLRMRPGPAARPPARVAAPVGVRGSPPAAAQAGGAPQRTGATAHAVEMFAGLLAEIRAYGEGLIIAEQIPSKLIPDVIKNTAVKIVHRLPAADDREMVGATMNITDAQSRYLVTLPPGEAAVFTDGMDYPVLAAMPDGTAREAAAPTATASPADIVSPRSGTCGPDCRTTPCTLRDMRAAQRTLAAEPGLVLWAEVAVLAHLTGWLMPLHPRERTCSPDRRLVCRRPRPGLRRVACGGCGGSRTSQHVLRAGQRGRVGISRGGGPAPVDHGRRTRVRLPRTPVAGPRFSLGPDPG